MKLGGAYETRGDLEDGYANDSWGLLIKFETAVAALPSCDARQRLTACRRGRTARP